MLTNELVGIWKLEPDACRLQAENGGDLPALKLIKFKADGTFVDAVETPSYMPGRLPPRVHRKKGSWVLRDNVLERTFPPGTLVREDGTSPEYSHACLVAVNGDSLEIAAPQFDQKNDKNYVGVFVYSRVRI
jgi:hypothetical protein